MGSTLKVSNLLIIYSIAYFLIVISPYFVVIAAPGAGLGWVPDTIDLILYFPVFGIILLELFRNVVPNDAPKSLQYLILLAIMLHFYGHGFHWAANAINTRIPANSELTVKEWAYFLDEILGHKIMFGGLLLFVFSMSFCEIVYTKYGAEQYSRTKLALFAMFQGVTLTLAFIEGQFIYDAFVLIAIYTIFLAALGKKFENFREILKKPFVFFWLVTLLSIYLWSALYILLFGGLFQPSELYGF